MAFEAAQQLMAKGIDVKGLILIDSPSPINHEALPNEVIAKIIQSGSAKQNHALDSNVALREEFQHNASLLKTYKPLPVSEENGSRFKVVMLRSQDTFDTENLCGVRYDWLTSQETRDAAIVSWEKLVGGHVEVFPIPGNHFEAFSPKNVRMLPFWHFPWSILIDFRSPRPELNF
jgi:thioesterase domain-containing protein